VTERAEHLAWCKTRALEYLDEDDVRNAIASMMSDMGKHGECGIPTVLVQLGLMCAIQDDADGARRWITGFK
jgi:hypothetical protein